jgi:hypothetical protein
MTLHLAGAYALRWWSSRTLRPAPRPAPPSWWDAAAAWMVSYFTMVECVLCTALYSDVRPSDSDGV